MSAQPCFRALVIGFYGAPNVGDEALLDLLIARVREQGGEPVIASIDPVLSAHMHGVDAVQFANLGEVARALLHSDVLIMGGGGIFQDHHPFNLDAVFLPYANDISDYARPVLLAQQLSVPVIIWAHGVGPLRNEGARALVRDVFQQALAVSVRDAASAALLRDIGVDRDIIVAPDPGWLFRRHHPLPLHATTAAAGSGKVLAVVVREWSKGHWKDALVAALRTGVPDDWRIVWVAFQAHTEGSGAVSDLPLIEDLRMRLGERHENELATPETPEQAWALLARADAVLSMRLHASIFALSAGKPTAGIEYDAKLAHAHAMAGMPAELRLSIDDGPSRFLDAIRSVLAEDRAWRPSPEVLEGLAVSAGAHIDLLDVCNELPPHRIGFSAAQSMDWLSLWLQQTLSELGRVKAESGRAHELLSYRDYQLEQQTALVGDAKQQLALARAAADREQQQAGQLRDLLEDLRRRLRDSDQAVSGLRRELADQQAQLDDSMAPAQLQSRQLQDALAQARRECVDQRACVDDRELHIAMLRQQVEQLEAELVCSRRETADAPGQRHRVGAFVLLMRHDVARLVAAPFKLISIWRRHGPKVALEQVTRRLQRLGMTPFFVSSPVPVLSTIIRPVRRERLLVLVGSTHDREGWPSRAMQLAKAAERAGFFVRITAMDGNVWPDEASGFGESLCVDANGWQQQIRAAGTRVLLADASASARSLAASARERGAEVIVDLVSLGCRTLSPDLRAVADRVIRADPEPAAATGLPEQWIGDAGDNEVFDSYRRYSPPPDYPGDRKNILLVELDGAAGGWLDAALQVDADVLVHVVGLPVDGLDARLVRASTWSWQPAHMAPLLAAVKAVVISGGRHDPERFARLAMASLLLEKPVFVDRLPAFGPSGNLHLVEDVAYLPALLRAAEAVEDYAFIAHHTWLGQVERLLHPQYPESVSVVVLIHNNRRIIKRCVSTLLEQAGAWLREIVVVDNQSADGGAELVESLHAQHPKVKLVRNHENGCSSGRNLGVRHTTGKYIAFFDSDQWLTSPSCFAEAVNILESNDGVGVVGWNAGWFDATRDDLGGPISDYLPNRGMNAQAWIKGYRDDVGFLGTSCMFISRELFDRLEGFDTFYDPTCFEDTDICFQVKKAGYAVAFRDFAGVRHQPHQTTGANEGSERYRRLFNRNAAYFREKWKAYPAFFVGLQSWH